MEYCRVIELTPQGRPADALAVVEVSGRAPAGAVDELAEAVRSSGRVTVGVSDGPVHPSWWPLLPHLACTLVPRGDPDAPETCVATDTPGDALADLRRQIDAAPIAALTLTEVLRLTPQLSVQEGLLLESLAYSCLLAGEEFAAWRGGHARREVDPPTHPVVLVDRADATLTVTLNRPERHNAYGAFIRDQLLEALAIATCDDSLTRVVLRGAGPSFCSGGDLDEFGTTPDAATAHVIRIQRSAGAVVHALRSRVEAHVHGACIGAGVELPAFCGTVVATEDAFFQLPELGMGLLPGAGGTVSLPRRIGRWRTAYLALSGTRIDVDTAMAWGLVDHRE